MHNNSLPCGKDYKQISTDPFDYNHFSPHSVSEISRFGVGETQNLAKSFCKMLFMKSDSLIDPSIWSATIGSNVQCSIRGFKEVLDLHLHWMVKSNHPQQVWLKVSHWYAVMVKHEQTAPFLNSFGFCIGSRSWFVLNLMCFPSLQSCGCLSPNIVYI